MHSSGEESQAFSNIAPISLSQGRKWELRNVRHDQHPSKSALPCPAPPV